MRFIKCGDETFEVCDFCERDSSGAGIIAPIGGKGICQQCLEEFANLLKEVFSCKSE